MQGKRHSRGNVAVAALMFVMLVGVAAVALDSVRPINTESQVAAAPKATEKKDETITKKCTTGYDYVVRMNEKGVANVKPTLGDEDVKEVSEAEGDQCKKWPLDTQTAFRGGRKCDDTWKCQVWMCVPAKLTTDGKREECRRYPGEEVGNGQALEAPKFKTRIVDVIAQNIEDAPPQRAEQIISETKKMDSTLSNSIFHSLGGEDHITNLTADVKDANAEAARLKALADGCTPGLTDGVDSCAGIRQEAAEADAKARALRDEAQKMNAFKKELDPNSTTCTGEKCIKGPDGKLVPDDRFKPDNKGCTFGSCGNGNDGSGNGSGGNQSSGNSSSGGGLGDIMKGLGQFAPLIGQLLNNAMQGSRAPTCTLKASPTNISRPGQPVTLSWTTQNAQQAYLSASGQVGPTGQITVNPQQTTTYTMQVVGYPQQQPYNPYGQQQSQSGSGNFCVTSTYPLIFSGGPWQPGCLNAPPTNYGQQQQSYGQPAQQAGPPPQGNCQVQVTLGQNSGGSGSDDKGGDKGSGDKPKAQISCQPKIADVGMSVSISYACQNATASKGEGFSTGDKLSGSASADVKSPEKGSTTVKYGLTCTKDGATDSAECTVNVNKPSIVLVANPKNVKDGEKTTIGWVTGAMESCVVSSPDLSEFTEANKNNTSTSGSAKTPPLERNTKFVLTCTTKAGGTKTAETTVEVGN